MLANLNNRPVEYPVLKYLVLMLLTLCLVPSIASSQPLRGVICERDGNLIVRKRCGRGANRVAFEDVRGQTGQGVAGGGATGQVLSKASENDFDTEWVSLPSQTVATFAGSTDEFELSEFGLNLIPVNGIFSVDSPITDSNISGFSRSVPIPGPCSKLDYTLELMLSPDPVGQVNGWQFAIRSYGNTSEDIDFENLCVISGSDRRCSGQIDVAGYFESGEAKIILSANPIFITAFPSSTAIKWALRCTS